MASHSAQLAVAGNSHPDRGDPLGGLFQPDVMLPSQFGGDNPLGIRGGERKLMAAILSDGVEAYISQCLAAHYRQDGKRSDAQDWVDIKDYSYVFSFDNVCSSLGIDPDYLRRGLERYVGSVIDRRQTGSGSPVAIWKKIRRPRK